MAESPRLATARLYLGVLSRPSSSRAPVSISLVPESPHRTEAGRGVAGESLAVASLRVASIAPAASAARAGHAPGTQGVVAEESAAFAGDHWPVLRAMYPPEKLARALVPFWVAAALRENPSPVACLAPGVDARGDLADAIAEAGLRDGVAVATRGPGENRHDADSGFDDGFVAAAGPEGLRLAEWWAEQVVRHGVDVDWLARLPAVSGAVTILRDLALEHAPASDLGDRETEPDQREAESLTTADGLPLDERLRALYARAWRSGEVTADPLEAGGAAAFRAWLNEPDPDLRSGGTSRYLFSLYLERRDIRDAYPDLSDPMLRDGFHRWAFVDGAAEYEIPPPLLPPRPRSLGDDVTAEPAMPQWGLNVVGHFHAEFGLGETARRMVEALDAVGLPAVPVEPGLAVPATRRGADYTVVPRAAAPFVVNLLCLNAADTPRFAREAGEGFFAGRRTAGLWWWETEDFPPAYDEVFEHVDEIWAGSRHVRDAIARRSTVPVVLIPHPVRVPAAGAPQDVAPRRATDDFTFLFVYDYNSVARRKNPLGLIDAFQRAFAPGDGPRLVLKTINADRHPGEHEQVSRAAAAHPDIEVMDGFLSGSERDALIASCDAYVSLHRAEGFGQTIAEAVWLGKPTLATAYSGNLDFMTEETSYLIPCSLVPVGDAAGPYPAEGNWAEPDLDAAAAAMRRVVAEPEEAAARARLGAERIRLTHSPEASGAAIRARLEALRPKIEDVARADRAREESLIRSHFEPARSLIRAGAESYESQGGPMRRRARNALLVALRPLTAFQRDSDEKQLAAVERAIVEQHRLALRSADSQHALYAATLARARRNARQLEDLRASTRG
jgi:glycosyltransferase involved in cell wall biosynthesis